MIKAKLKMLQENFGVAVFPFLKTRQPIKIGTLEFRSTDNLDDLTPDQRNAVEDIRDMLFYQDDLLVKNASYAITPAINIDLSNNPVLGYLKEVRDVISYFYSAPNGPEGDVFLSPEHCSLAIFRRQRFTKLLLTSGYHVRSVSGEEVAPNMGHDEVDGYCGMYNLEAPFWVAKGSRLYGPLPHMTLNIAQDLGRDIPLFSDARPDYQFLRQLLLDQDSPIRARAMMAVKWFNLANSGRNHDDAALLHLAVAFEVLLQLPDSSKTDRLVDGISMLLGRIDRLNSWARQFYNARSAVAHEGRSDRQLFLVETSKQSAETDSVRSLLSYGRQIFQLCLATLLVGADLAERAQLREKFISHSERFIKITNILDEAGDAPASTLLSVGSILSSIRQYQFSETGSIRLDLLIGVVRRAAKLHLQTGDVPSDEITAALTAMVATKPKDPLLDQLSAVNFIVTALQASDRVNFPTTTQTIAELVDIAWHWMFMTYYRLLEAKRREAPLTGSIADGES